MRAKLLLARVFALRRKMHEPVGAVGAWLKRVVDGYYRYHAVPGNPGALGRPTVFACCGGKPYSVAVSGGNRDVDRLRPIFERWIPRPRTLHPYPEADATHPR